MQQTIYRIRLKVLILLTTVILSYINAQESIHWREWNALSFADAQKNNKLIFVDIGMEGCTACRWMVERTYTHPDVIHLINEHFIAIQVDSESRPDIGERYSDWAWPALIFMSPAGKQVHAIRGSRSPQNFIAVLEELIKRQKNHQLIRDDNAPFPAPNETNSSPLDVLKDQVLGQLDNIYDETLGGWGSQQKSLYSYAQIYQLELRGHRGTGPYPRRALFQTINGLLKQIDTVWGGVFVASINKWENIVPEKRISNQAAAMSAFAAAYWLSGDEKYLRGARYVDKYMSGMMMDKNGTFYTSQEDVATRLPVEMDARAYYRLMDNERRSYGIPPIDHSVYTHKNGEMISAYVRLFEVSRQTAYLDKARRAADFLLKERMQPPGWMLQTLPSSKVSKDNRMRKQVVQKRPYLKAQAYFALALIDLARATGDKPYLRDARRLTDAMIDQFWDKTYGGFFASVPDDVNRFVPLQKPVEDNAVAALVLYQMSVYFHQPSYYQYALKTIQAVSLPYMVKREGRMVAHLAVALEWMSKKYVEFSITGSPDLAETRALFRTASQIYEPRKILHFQEEGRYPAQKRPAVFICNPLFCTNPLFSSKAVIQQAATF
ncbi:MAG: thioredoxin domain-containing protein [Calditrichaeota bacterium]|nr:MAG: thioredoxin domain-containing protein [Calditrichota bacterium]